MENTVIIFLAVAFLGNVYAGEPTSDNTVVVLQTNQGNIEIRLFKDMAPKTCENFIGLIKKGYYDGTIFHRVVKNFVIQGGDPTGTGMGGRSIWDKFFQDEFTPGVNFDRAGLVAMANFGIPNTNMSQFFITTRETPHLNKKHTIFGEVISGYDVVQKIENTPTNEGEMPITEQKIIKAYLK